LIESVLLNLNYKVKDVLFACCWLIRRMMNKKPSQWLCVILIGSLSVLKTYGFYVNITYLESAVDKGAGKVTKTQICSLLECINIILTCFGWKMIISAVCLDGSPPAYHWDKGSGAGINNWLVHIEVRFSFPIMRKLRDNRMNSMCCPVFSVCHW